MTQQRNFLVVDNLTVTFSRWGQTVKALDSVSLTVPAGQWLALVGQNGSGKSTLLKVISGRIKADGGRVLIGDEDVVGMSAQVLAWSVFHVHQDPLLGTAPKLTVFENLLVADHQAQLHREPKSLLAKKYREMLLPIGLSGRMKQLVKTLSGGERQLLALLIARLRPAPLVLLDEPLAALDPAKADMCMRLIESLHQEGKTLILVTHDEGRAAALGNRVVVINGGKIVYDALDGLRSRSSLIEHWYSVPTGG